MSLEEKSQLVAEKDKGGEMKQSESKLGMKTVKGIVAICITALFASLSGTCVQGLQRRIPDFELNSIRSVIAWIPVAGYCLIRKISPMVNGRKDAVWVAVYAVVLFSSTAAFFACVTFIPMAMEESIYHTTQIFGGLVLFWIIVGEKPTMWKAFSLGGNA